MSSGCKKPRSTSACGTTGINHNIHIHIYMHTSSTATTTTHTTGGGHYTHPLPYHYYHNYFHHHHHTTGGGEGGVASPGSYIPVRSLKHRYLQYICTIPKLVALQRGANVKSWPYLYPRNSSFAEASIKVKQSG